jgi:pimeloyl-ACP methyl ester carboxylesterase
VHDELGHERVVLMGGDLGGPVIQDLALRHPEWVDRMVLFNSPLPFDKERMAGIADTRPPREASDYFVRQGLDPDGLAAELRPPGAPPLHRHVLHQPILGAPGRVHRCPLRPRRRAWSTSTPSRSPTPHKLRAEFGAYESTFSSAARSEASVIGRNDTRRTLILHGPSDHVIYPAFDRMAAAVFADHVGPFLLRDCGHFVPWEAPHALCQWHGGVLCRPARRGLATHLTAVRWTFRWPPGGPGPPRPPGPPWPGRPG